MNNKSPSELFGGTWEQIKNRFLYCSDSSGQKGGSKKIRVEQLPEHDHTITNYYDDFNYNNGVNTTDDNLSDTQINSIPNDVNYYETHQYSRKTWTDKNGSGADYMPPYITVYAWYRTA